MLKVGITGGIGSGKSTVSNIFKTIGIPIFDADAAARKVMNEDAALKESIIKVFGEPSYEKGALNRQYIAGIVFQDSFKLEQLNAMVHPVTIALAQSWMQEQTTPFVIKEAAILFESGAAHGLDYIIGVFAPQHLRIQRVMQRDKVSKEEVLSRMSKQVDENMKMKLCDFIIKNDELQLLIPQVLKLHEILLKLANEKTTLSS
ncbi:dephospho-CoA kinase [soil metagenome]